MKRSLEVADIFRAFGPDYREVHGSEMPLRQLRVMRAIEVCRTADLGAISINAMAVVNRGSLTTPAGIGIVPNVNL